MHQFSVLSVDLTSEHGERTQHVYKIVVVSLCAMNCFPLIRVFCYLLASYYQRGVLGPSGHMYVGRGVDMV